MTDTITANSAKAGNGADVPMLLSIAPTGDVMLSFQHPMDFVALTPEMAIQVGMVLVDKAYEAKGELKPAGGAVKQELIDRHRKTLIRRLEIHFNSQRERKKMNNAMLARHCVETMLNEVFK